MISIDDAMQTVAYFELMAYFNTISPTGRVLIAEELMAMMNWPPERRLHDGVKFMPYVEPRVRLERFMRQLKHITAWPGMGEIRAMYCKLYPPADNINVESCTIPGYTDEECLANIDFISLDSGRQEQKFIPGPDDEPIGDFALEISKTLKDKFGASDRDCTCVGDAINPTCPKHAVKVEV